MTPEHKPKSGDSIYQLQDIGVGDNAAPRLVLTGNLTLAALEQQFRQLSAELSSHAQNPDIHWDLSGVRQIDYAGTPCCGMPGARNARTT